MLNAGENLEQEVLKNWYATLESKGTLNWNITDDLCKQSGITCQSDDVGGGDSIQKMFDLFLFYFNRFG